MLLCRLFNTGGSRADLPNNPLHLVALWEPWAMPVKWRAQVNLRCGHSGSWALERCVKAAILSIVQLFARKYARFLLKGVISSIQLLYVSSM